MAIGLGSNPKSRDLIDVSRQGAIVSLEPGAEFEGKLRISSGTARLNSHFKGEISGEGALWVAERGEVEAEINVGSITVSGKVKGTVHVTDRIEIKERGVILGDIHTPVLVVEPGGYFDGQCHMPAQESETSKIGSTEIKDPRL